MEEEKKQTFDGIIDWNVIKTHQIKEFTPEQNKEIVKLTRNFEKAHLKAYLKGYTQEAIKYLKNSRKSNE